MRKGGRHPLERDTGLVTNLCKRSACMTDIETRAVMPRGSESADYALAQRGSMIHAAGRRA